MGIFKNTVCKSTQTFTDEKRDLIFLSSRYSEMLMLYFKKNIRFPVNKEHKSYEKQIEQLKKLLSIIQELNVDPQQYLKAQFEMLTPWIKKKKYGYLTIYMLTSDKAKERWYEWLNRIDNQNELKRDKIQVQYNSNVTENLRPVIFRSIKNFYAVLLWYQSRDLLDRPTALKQLEICHKLGDVDSMYIYINPMIKPICENKYLREIWITQNKQLSKRYKEWLQKLFEETRPVVEENGVEKYV